ncbi:MAG: methanogenesis marker 3 protein, partial [Candidatus Korarchaeum sp.]|nr:methanogenesis marker 3 protein [Candidatus Korarchaeum sp.]MDW8035505.1 methanogenesis marker 3 protein [Candidatus Korarchaeum sp.]
VMEYDEIYSMIEVDLNIDLPLASEHVLMSFERNATVNDVTETYIKLDSARKVLQIEENPEKRTRGTVTIRVSGSGEGNIYVYRQDRMPSKNHSVVGYVKHGMELLEVAERGDMLYIVTNPKRINLVGLTQGVAEKILNDMGIVNIREGDKADDALIISQSPETTSEILKMRKVVTYSVDRSRVVKIKLFDNTARRTSPYFRVVTGLVGRSVGSLKVFFKTEDLILFKPDDRYRDYYKEPLIPENTPQGIVKPGDIGVTNMSSRYAGFIGIRLTESREYGPTAETFESTNIVGEIVNDLDVVRKLGEGDVLYFVEVGELED